MSTMTQNSATDLNFKVKEIEKVKFYILNEFFVHKPKQTYIDFIFMYIKAKTWKLYLKFPPKNWTFWSCDGIKIFSLDLVYKLFIGLHKKFIKNCCYNIDFKSGRGVLYVSPGLSVCQYGLSVGI